MQPITSITERSSMGITKLVKGVERMTLDVVEAGPIIVREVTDLLEAAVKDEFVKGGHTGRSDEDRTDQHPRTLDTVEKSSNGPVGRVSMAGGAAYVEFGTSAHQIAPRDAQALHWREGGADYFSKGHEVSGTKEDDFAGRAIADVEAEAVMGAVFSQSFVQILKEIE